MNADQAISELLQDAGHPPRYRIDPIQEAELRDVTTHLYWERGLRELEVDVTPDGAFGYLQIQQTATGDEIYVEEDNCPMAEISRLVRWVMEDDVDVQPPQLP